MNTIYKTVLIVTILLLKNAITSAQSPPGIPYQAIARTTTGEPYAAGALQARFSLHEETATGTVSYAETHSLQTDEFGLFSTTFGAGAPVTGTFAAINWGLTTKYLQVEVDLGTGWIDMGTQQLMSVPYAMYAGSANSVASAQNQMIIGNGFSTISTATFNGSLMQSANYCATLDENGNTDWRLPNLDEVFNYVAINGVNPNLITFWTTTNSNYNILGPQGSIFPYTCFSSGEITVDSPYSNRPTKCVR
jgi:hypothetical protein